MASSFKVGLVGAGFVSRHYHVPSFSAIHEKARIVAICDPSEKAVGLLMKRYPVKRHYSNIDLMLKNEELDIVDIATPGFMHYDQACKSIERKTNVLIEKPVTLSSKDANDLNLRSEKYGVQVCVMQNYRFRDPSIQLKALQAAGRIGRINSVSTYQHGGTVFGQPSWMWDENVSGGILYENAVHAVDFCTWLLGPHKRILGFKSHYDKNLRLTTSIRALTEHGDNATSFLDLQWFASSMFYRSDIFASVCDVVINFQPDAIILHFGEHGPLTDAVGAVGRVYDFGKNLFMNRFAAASIKPHLHVISGFVRSIETGGMPPVAIDDVMPTMQLLDSLKRSTSMMNENNPVGL